MANGEVRHRHVGISDANEVVVFVRRVAVVRHHIAVAVNVGSDVVTETFITRFRGQNGVAVQRNRFAQSVDDVFEFFLIFCVIGVCQFEGVAAFDGFRFVKRVFGRSLDGYGFYAVNVFCKLQNARLFFVEPRQGFVVCGPRKFVCRKTFRHGYFKSSRFLDFGKVFGREAFVSVHGFGSHAFFVRGFRRVQIEVHHGTRHLKFDFGGLAAPFERESDFAHRKRRNDVAVQNCHAFVGRNDDCALDFRARFKIYGFQNHARFLHEQFFAAD